MNELREWWTAQHALPNNTEMLSNSDPKNVLETHAVYPCGTVLDIGVGFGRMAEHLHSLGCIVHSLDIVPEALEKVKPWTERRFLVGEPLPEDTYDLAIMHLVAQHISDHDLIAQLASILPAMRPGGVLSIQFASHTADTDQSLWSQQTGGVCRTEDHARRIIELAGGWIVRLTGRRSFTETKATWFVYHVVNKKTGTPAQGIHVKELLLDFGSQCNNRCIFCGSEKHPPSMLRLEDFQGFHDLIQYAERVDVTGTGEFTIHPDFREVVDTLTLAGKPFRMVTNGSNLGPAVRELLQKSTCNEICVSLNSLDKHTYEELCGAARWEQIMANLDALLNEPHSLKVFVSFVMTSLNFVELPRIVEFCAKADVPVSCMDLTPTVKNYPKGLVVPDTTENRKIIEDARQQAVTLRAQFSVFDFAKRYAEPTSGGEPLSERIKKCLWPYTAISIQANGNVVPCCWCRTSMGNVKRQTPEEIWNGPVYCDLRECVTKGDVKHCHDCRGFG